MSTLSSNAKLLIYQMKQLNMEQPDEPVTGIDLLNISGLTATEINLAVTDLLMERMVTVEVSGRRGEFDFSTIHPVEFWCARHDSNVRPLDS